MRLLKKEEIVKAKSLERRVEIEEGMKLAKKVDALRDILPREQKKLDDFRRETLASIHKDITEAEDKKTALMSEVKSLEERRVAALKPISHLWEEIRSKEKEVNEREEIVTKIEMEVVSLEQKAQKDLKKASDELKRSTNLKESALSDSIDADEKNRDATHRLEESAEIKRSADEYKKRIDHEIRDSYTQLSNHEKSLTIREAELAKNIQKNNEETIRLADMRATLERSLKRLKTKRG